MIRHSIDDYWLLILSFNDTCDVFVKLILPWFSNEVFSSFDRKDNLDVQLWICSCHIISPLQGSPNFYRFSIIMSPAAAGSVTCKCWLSSQSLEVYMQLYMGENLSQREAQKYYNFWFNFYFVNNFALQPSTYRARFFLVYSKFNKPRKRQAINWTFPIPQARNGNSIIFRRFPIQLSPERETWIIEKRL